MSNSCRLFGAINLSFRQRCIAWDDDIVTRHILYATVIRLRIRMAFDGHRQCGLVDRQLAVRHHRKGYILKVGVVVAELARSQSHEVRACIGLRQGRGAARADHFGGVEQTACTRGRVATDRMRLRIVSRRVCITGDRDGHRSRGDGLETIRHIEGHRAEIRIRVGELVGREVHVRRAHSRSGRRRHTAEREIVRGVQRGLLVVDLDARHLVARHCVGGAVIHITVVITHNGHRHRSRVHFHVTVRDMEPNDELVDMFGNGAEHILCQIHKRGSHNRTSGCFVRRSPYKSDIFRQINL